jgi:hypothetical protein
MENETEDLELSSCLNEKERLENEKDDFTFKAKINPKIDIKKLLKDQELSFKKVDISLSIHKEFEDTQTTVDAIISVDLKKALNGEGSSSINKASIMATKKF